MIQSSIFSTMPLRMQAQPSQSEKWSFLPMSDFCSGLNTLNTPFADVTVKDIVDTIIVQDDCVDRSASESSCAWRIEEKEECMDSRLKAWTDMLKARAKLQRRIQHQTGKRAEDVLFNRPATIDASRQQMMLRILDYAYRTNVTNFTKGIAEKPGTLKAICHPELCKPMQELQATLPQMDRMGQAQLSFVGLPALANLELASTMAAPESNWLRSELLQQRLEEQKGDIKRVLEYPPDIEKLQIAPSWPPAAAFDTKLIGEDLLLALSSDTTMGQLNTSLAGLSQVTEILPEPVPQAEYAINLNGNTYTVREKSSHLNAELQVYFHCDPHQRVRKTILELENVGEKLLYVNWTQHFYYKRRSVIHQTRNATFLFDKSDFVLAPGELHHIDVMYQPQVVGTHREQWSLGIERALFCGTHVAIIKLHGCCTPPVSYKEQLDRRQGRVFDNSNKETMDRLQKMQASIVPLIVPPLACCPFDRPLDERELFNAQNPGYNCKRYADLEAIKELHKQLKKPREPAWNFSLDSLRQMIMRHKEVVQRKYFNDALLNTLQFMRCEACEVFPRLESNPEQDLTRFIYVRGIVCSAIEDWEQLAIGLELSFFRGEMQRYVSDRSGNQMKGAGDMAKADPRSDEEIAAHLLKSLKTSKYFRDSLYMQSYTLLCDVAENIVSVIESTLQL